MSNEISNTLLSIVIPTKNRYQYLNILLESLVKFESNEFEVVIQDNSDDNQDFLKFLYQINDVRLKYFYNNSIMDAVTNCDLAFLHAKGRYICFIGDDDGVLPQLVTFINWMERNNIESACFKVGNYQWPDMLYKYYSDKMAGLLTFDTEELILENLNIKEEYNKLFTLGAQIFPNIPKAYHAVVSKKCLDALYDKTGTYFPGPVPDMANAVGLKEFVNSHIYISLPFVISGQGGKSMSGKGAMKKHHGKIEDEKSLPIDTIKNWSKEIPRFWSGPTIWAEATLKALEKTGQLHEKNRFNFAYMYASCLSFNTQYFLEIFRALNNSFSFGKRVYIYTKIPYYIFKINLKRLITHMNNFYVLRKKEEKFERAQNISFVIDRINKKLEKSQWLKILPV